MTTRYDNPELLTKYIYVWFQFKQIILSNSNLHQ